MPSSPRALRHLAARLLLFGHGFLGSAQGELGGPEGSYVQSFLDDTPLAVWGLPPTKGPLPSALTLWDTNEAEQPPTGNLAASVTIDNHAHSDVRELPAVNTQIDHFLRQGEVVSTCSGPCDPQ